MNPVSWQHVAEWTLLCDNCGGNVRASVKMNMLNGVYVAGYKHESCSVGRDTNHELSSTYTLDDLRDAFSVRGYKVVNEV